MKDKFNKALKKLYSKELPKENFLLIRFDYYKQLVLPYEEGIKLMSTLKNAQLMEDNYGKPKKFTSFSTTDFTTSILTREEYEYIKIAAMLNVTVEELKQQLAEQPETA